MNFVLPLIDSLKLFDFDPIPSITKGHSSISLPSLNVP